jgi:hypothetical protein
MALTANVGKKPLPPPKIRTFESWDKRDGQGCFKNVGYWANKQIIEWLQGVIWQELSRFPRADALFSRMITSSKEYLCQAANFLMEIRSVSHHQNIDLFESWEYPCYQQ